MPEARAARPPDGAPHAFPDSPLAALPWIAWLTVGLVALGVACRLFRFWLNFPIWTDEASLALNFVERDYRGLLRELNFQQVAPLLFLWIEKSVWQWAGPSEWLLRGVPWLAGIGGLLLFWRLARARLPGPSALFAVGILAVSAWPIELACSIKPYALDLFAAVLLLWLAVHARRRPRAWLPVLAFLIPFVVCLSYPAVFVAGAISLVLAPVVWRRGDWLARGGFIAFNVLLVAAFAAHLHFVGREKDPANPPDLEGYMRSFWQHGFPHGGALKSAWWVVRVHVGKMFSYPVEFNGGGVAGLALVGLGVHALARQGRRALLLLCILPFALHLLAACLHRYPYGMSPRLEQHLAPGFCMLAGTGLAALIERLAATPHRQARWLWAAAAGLVLVGVGGAIAAYRQPWHDEVAAWARGIVQHLQREMHPGDRVVVRGTPDSCPVCLRWQLLALADHIDYEAFPAASARPTAARIWIVDPRGDEAPMNAPEPPSCAPDGTPDWHTLDHRRFRAAFGYSSSVYRYFCDVYLCAPTHAQAAR